MRWKSETHSQCELGSTLQPDYTQWKRGGGCAELLRLGNEADGFHRNEGAATPVTTLAPLMERLGMRRESNLVENEWFKGEWGSELDTYARRECRARQGLRGHPATIIRGTPARLRTARRGTRRSAANRRRPNEVVAPAATAVPSTRSSPRRRQSGECLNGRERTANP